MTDPNTDRDARNPLDVPPQQLEAEIKQAIQQLWDIAFKHSPEAHNNVLTATRNARLLVLLGRQTDEQTKRIIRLTWGLFGLTVALLVIAAIQVAIMLVEHAAKTP